MDAADRDRGAAQAMIEEGQSQGKAPGGCAARRSFRRSDRRRYDPRPDMICIDADATVAEARTRRWRQNTPPPGDRGHDHVIGILYVKDICPTCAWVSWTRRCARWPGPTLRPRSLPAGCAPAPGRAAQFMAIVYDEHGGTAGR